MIRNLASEILRSYMRFSDVEERIYRVCEQTQITDNETETGYDGSWDLDGDIYEVRIIDGIAKVFKNAILVGEKSLLFK